MHKFHKNSDNENIFVSEKLAAAQRFSTKKASRTVGTTGARFHKGCFTVRFGKERKVHSAFFLSFFVQPTQVLSVKQTAGAVWSVGAIRSLAEQRELLEFFLERNHCHSLDPTQSQFCKKRNANFLVVKNSCKTLFLFFQKTVFCKLPQKKQSFKKKTVLHNTAFFAKKLQQQLHHHKKSNKV